MRGYFKGVLDPLEIARHPKAMQIGLTETHMLWLDFFLDQSIPTDLQTAIRKGLTKWKQNVAQHCDKRFLYFLASRTKVRFSTRRQPRYSKWRDRFIFWIEVGRSARPCRIEIEAPFRVLASNEPVRFPAKTTAKFITFFVGSGAVSRSVHDFLLECNASIGIDTNVHYVGCTKTPDSRVLSKEHHGFAQMLHDVSGEDSDFFLFQHLFKPVVLAAYPGYGLHVVAANSAVDLADIESEGSMIEKALIAYFEPSTQLASLKAARSELRGILARHCVEKMMLGIDYQQPREYYRYVGTGVGAHDRVGGIYRIIDNELSVTRDPTLDVSQATSIFADAKCFGVTRASAAALSK